MSDMHISASNAQVFSQPAVPGRADGDSAERRIESGQAGQSDLVTLEKDAIRQ